MNISDYLDIIGAHPRSRELSDPRVPNANEPSDGDRLYRFRFGEHGETVVDCFADSAEDAFEIAVEWLDDNAPGHLVTIGDAELKEAAEELGLAMPVVHDCAGGWDDAWSEGIGAKIIEHAERDLTIIGHTTLENGQYILSHEWTFSEIT
jgi:hypothetical protein